MTLRHNNYTKYNDISNRTIIICMFCMIILWTDMYCYLLCIAWAVFMHLDTQQSWIQCVWTQTRQILHSTHSIVASFNWSSSFRQIPHMVTSEFKSSFLVFSWSSSPGFRKVFFSCDLGFLVEWNVKNYAALPLRESYDLFVDVS